MATLRVPVPHMGPTTGAAPCITIERSDDGGVYLDLLDLKRADDDWDGTVHLEPGEARALAAALQHFADEAEV